MKIFNDDIIEKVIQLGKLGYPPAKCIRILGLDKVEAKEFNKQFSTPNTEVFVAYQTGADLADFEIDTRLYQLASIGEPHAIDIFERRRDKLREEYNNRPRGGRPRSKIDWDLVFDMFRKQCTVLEVASAIGITRMTLYDRCVQDNKKQLSELIQQAKESGKASLRMKQLEKAFEGDKTMLIWGGKQYLGQSENVSNDSEAVDKLDELLKRLDDNDK